MAVNLQSSPWGLTSEAGLRTQSPLALVCMHRSFQWGILLPALISCRILSALPSACYCTLLWGSSSSMRGFPSVRNFPPSPVPSQGVQVPSWFLCILFLISFALLHCVEISLPFGSLRLPAFSRCSVRLFHMQMYFWYIFWGKLISTSHSTLPSWRSSSLFYMC